MNEKTGRKTEDITVGELFKMPPAAWEAITCSICFVFTHLRVTANSKWELFVNKLLSDVCVCVCVCVTVMK
jgi:hypothetical protein